MRLLLFIACVTLAAAVRDAAFWERLLWTMSPKGDMGIIRNIASLFNSFIQEFELTNDRRISHFLGQCTIESAWFRTTTEYANGVKYNGRRDLGNTQPGDGPRFKGRGLIQLTGRGNYDRVGRLIGQDLVSNPTSVAGFPLALTVSGIYWRTRAVDGNSRVHLNDAADQDDVVKVTRNVNGRKMLALEDRRRMTRRAFQLLQADKAPGAVTGTVPHLDIDPSVFSWVNPNDDQPTIPSLPTNPNIVADEDPAAPFLTFKPPTSPTRYISYVFEAIAHYTDGKLDTDLIPSQIAKPDPARGPVAYYLNGQVVYVSDVSGGVAPTPRVQQLLQNR